MNEKLENLKKGFEQEASKISIDDSRVQIAEMQISAIKELANESNQIFSQLSPAEVFDVSRAYVFAQDPLPSLSKRLESKGISFRFELPILKNFLDENIKHRHKIDRKRVSEYIEAIKNIAQKNVYPDDTMMKKGMMSRII